MSEPTPDFDGAWKEATELFLPQSLALMRPEIHRGIDWSRPPVYLDTELRKITADAEHGRQIPDRLIGIARTDTDATDALLHLETQSQTDPQMPLRMYRYHGRLFEMRGKDVVSLAILADDDPDWRPHVYQRELWGCRTRFEFLTCKLLDFSDEELFHSQNPVAKIILAQRIAQRTARNSSDRFRMKLKWLERLLEQGFSAEDTPKLFRMLERMTPLSRDLDIEFHRQLHHYSSHKTMTFITTLEQFAMDKGLQAGWVQSLKSLVSLRFSDWDPAWDKRLESIEDASRFQELQRLAMTLPTAEEFLKAIGNAEN